jgi:hypothetical protein
LDSSNIKTKYFALADGDSGDSTKIKGRVWYRGIFMSPKRNDGKAGTALDGTIKLMHLEDDGTTVSSDVGIEIKVGFGSKNSAGNDDTSALMLDGDGYIEFPNGLALQETGSTGSVFDDLRFTVFYEG